jgi:nucleotide-binding universal stress UspA family protein
MAGASHEPVVVGMDGSSEALRAAAYGAWEAKRRNAPLRLVFAHQPAPLWGPSILLAEDYRWERHWARDMLAEAEQRVIATNPDVTLQPAVVSGSAAGALVDESRRASLVVLGTRAAAGVIGHLSGSVAAQAAAHAHTPVIVIRPTVDVDVDVDVDPTVVTDRPVIVGLDGSVESEHAMAFAVEEAVARGADLHAVYVWNVLEVHDLGPIVASEIDADEEEKKAYRLLTEATEGWAADYPDLTIARRVIHGLDAVDALSSHGQDAGLIVVGSRGHGGFLGLRLGSTVDGLIRRAGPPLAVVRGRDAVD